MVPADVDGELCSTAFCVIRPDRRVVLPGYVFFYVSQDRFVARVSEHQRGSSYPAVADGDVYGESISFPPRKEDQQSVTNALARVDQKIEAEESRKTALDALFKTLLHDLMTAKIRLPAEFIACFASDEAQEDHGQGSALPEP